MWTMQLFAQEIVASLPSTHSVIFAQFRDCAAAGAGRGRASELATCTRATFVSLQTDTHVYYVK